MHKPPALESRILAPADARAWRRSLQALRVAVVTGSYDLLQPGNLLALHTAARNADRVCVVLESDALVASHAGQGRPQNPLPVRAEFLASLKAVSTVTAAESARQAGEIFNALRPFAWVSCPARRDDDPFAGAAADAADTAIETPLVPGCAMTSAWHGRTLPRLLWMRGRPARHFPSSRMRLSATGVPQPRSKPCCRTGRSSEP